MTDVDALRVLLASDPALVLDFLVVQRRLPESERFAHFLHHAGWSRPPEDIGKAFDSLMADGFVRRVSHRTPPFVTPTGLAAHAALLARADRAEPSP